jgi:DNA-binding NarL/FixJ family response regulator
LKVLLADDDPHVRSAVRLLLADEPGLQVAADCQNAAALLEAALSCTPDVVLVDWELPGLHPAGDVRRLRACAPQCRVVAMSGRPEQRREALRAGAFSFVCKGDAPDALLAVLRQLVRVALE